MSDTEGTIPAEVRDEFYEGIEADSDRLLDMINELLDVSRLEAGRSLTLALKPVEMRPLLEKLARRHRYYKFFTNQHEIVTEYASDAPETIEADEDKLNQIISNFLSNAIKYSPHGGRITLATEAGSEGVLVLRISDQGVGMTEEQISRLFQQYERVERDDIRNIPGTGLGLYLVKHLVELHGGEITCESAPGKGSTFCVHLPVSQPES
jgi:signal transduction histidine kinase